MTTTYTFNVASDHLTPQTCNQPICLTAEGDPIFCGQPATSLIVVKASWATTSGRPTGSDDYSWACDEHLAGAMEAPLERDSYATILCVGL